MISTYYKDMKVVLGRQEKGELLQRLRPLLDNPKPQRPPRPVREYKWKRGWFHGGVTESYKAAMIKHQGFFESPDMWAYAEKGSDIRNYEVNLAVWELQQAWGKALDTDGELVADVYDHLTLLRNLE